MNVLSTNYTDAEFYSCLSSSTGINQRQNVTMKQIWSTIMTGQDDEVDDDDDDDDKLHVQIFSKPNA